jgi:hypothetical protein
MSYSFKYEIKGQTNFSIANGYVIDIVQILKNMEFIASVA